VDKQSLTKTITNISEFIDSASECLGKCIAWLVLAMVILVSYDVAMRYFFRSGSVGLQELEWHLFSIIILLGAAYTLKHDAHVRLELFYHSQYMNDYRRAWVNFIGSLLFLVPFCVLIIVCSWPFLSQSFIHAESSPDPGGLPYRWLLKAAIPLGFILLLIQGLGNSLKNLALILEKGR